jgi:hypothetical protein
VVARDLNTVVDFRHRPLRLWLGKSLYFDCLILWMIGWDVKPRFLLPKCLPWLRGKQYPMQGTNLAAVDTPSPKKHTWRPTVPSWRITANRQKPSQNRVNAEAWWNLYSECTGMDTKFKNSNSIYNSQMDWVFIICFLVEDQSSCHSCQLGCGYGGRGCLRRAPLYLRLEKIFEVMTVNYEF